nr:carboxypeptidase-like regulatory domain-containing protein [uncultured Allomuricauda sp.]
MNNIKLITLLVISIFSHGFIAAQEQESITGRLINESGEPISGASIIVKGKNEGATTDFDGNFSLEATKDDIIVISYSGFNTKEIKIGNNKTLNIMLTEIEVTTRFWCCTSHADLPHCAKSKGELRSTHPADEIYTRNSP